MPALLPFTICTRPCCVPICRKPKKRSIEIDASTDDQSRGFITSAKEVGESSASFGALSPLSSMELSAEPLSPSTLAFFKAARSEAAVHHLEEAAKLRVFLRTHSQMPAWTCGYSCRHPTLIYLVKSPKKSPSSGMILFSEVFQE